MITRREVIASGLAVSVLARTSAASLSGVHPTTSARAVRVFVADERFPEARAAARAADAVGSRIVMLAGDVTGLYQSLDLAWRSTPFAISGLTTTNALFVIERLAWERGLRTIYRGMHRPTVDGRFQHKLLGSQPLIRRAGIRTTADWATVLGSTLAEWAPEVGDRRQITMSQTVPGADGTTLTSWLLAPKNEFRRRA